MFDLEGSVRLDEQERVFARIENMFDREACIRVSHLTDYAPLSGRNVMIEIRWAY